MADTPGFDRSKLNGSATVAVEADATRVSTSRQAGPLPFYMFEVYAPRNDDDGGSGFVLASAADLGGVEPQVTLRIPPSSLRITSPIRAELTLDLLGGVTAAQGGMGLRRWTISGTHGVGLGPGMVATAANGEVTMAKGYAVRQALAAFFEAWATANESRRKEQKPMLRMLFAIRGGTLTEFQNEEWWIQPDGLPEETRTVGRPLAWDWSLSFVALARFREGMARSPGAAPLMPPSSRAVREAIEEAEWQMEGVIARAQRSKLQAIMEKAQGIKASLQVIRDRVSSATSLYRNSVSGVAGYIRSCARLAQEALLLVDRSNLVDQPARDIYNSLREVQTAIGYAKMLSDGYLEPFSASAVRPPVAAIQQGDTLQAIAAREFGDAGRWKELADLNGLTYPYLDFSGPNGTPGTQFLGAGRKVLGQGDSLGLPNAAGAIAPADPIGTDLTEEGLKGTLVAGVDNLQVALLRRLRTPRGYMPHHPEYGSDLPSFVGRPLTPSLVLSIRAEVDRALREDPRVITVQSVGIAVEGDGIRVEAAASSVLGPVSLSGTVGGLSPV